MAWKAYRVVFRMRSPLHIGCGKVGNLQRTRHYVLGRVFWGALTLRLTRDAVEGRGPATDSRKYQKIGDAVHRSLAFTYFYPATKTETVFRIAWPWEEESRFRRRFLGSYGATALDYPGQSAARGKLHEVEFLSPRTLDTELPVYMVGHLFELDGCPLAWKEACKRLQVGGERGYGWGDLGLTEVAAVEEEIFERKAVFDGSGNRPILKLLGDGSTPQTLLAHARTDNLAVCGNVEPLVGREWRSHNTRHCHAGQHVSHHGVCFAPGSMVTRPCRFEIGTMGIWQAIQ